MTILATEVHGINDDAACLGAFVVDSALCQAIRSVRLQSQSLALISSRLSADSEALHYFARACTLDLSAVPLTTYP